MWWVIGFVALAVVVVVLIVFADPTLPDNYRGPY